MIKHLIKITLLSLSIFVNAHDSLASVRSAPIACEDVSTFFIPFPETPEAVEDFILQHEDDPQWLPFISSEKLEGLHRVSNDGRQNSSTHRASFEGDAVYVKATPTAIREAMWMHYVNPLGLGPRIYGITKIGREYAIVMRDRPGYNSKAWMGYTRLPQDFKMTPAMVEEMKRQTAILYKAGFINRDPQFLLDPYLTTMIDFELMRSASRHLRSQNLERVLEDIDNQIVKKWDEMRRLQKP